ncbi:neuropeptide FF receptor 2-like, partial [Gigantopelta aegis]|uniref:neuropeptide FF receptor 2-like n=1 Tax=Gigantopelta aegis TaxID=1735272 RepID=UPI001B88A3E3
NLVSSTLTNVSSKRLKDSTDYSRLTGRHVYFVKTFLITICSNKPSPSYTMSCVTTTVDTSGIAYRGNSKQVPDWEIAVKASIVVGVELMACVGNLLVMAIVVQSKKMRTTTNYYIVNLATSDLLVAIGPMWIFLVNDFTDGWVLGAFLCKCNAFVQIAAMCASVFTLMAIAGDRFFAIIFPLKSRVTQRKVSVVIVIIWISAFSIAMPPLFVYTYQERQWLDYVERFCTDVWPVVNTSASCDHGLTSKRAYWSLVVVVLNWVPMIVMIILYTVIIIKLRFNRVVPSSGALSMSAIQQRSKTKVVKMFFSVLIVFIICTVPFQVSKLFELYRDAQRERLPTWYNPVYFSAIMLMYTNSAINPIIYGGLNENFRNGFKDLINRILNRRSARELAFLNAISTRTRPSIVDDLGTKPSYDHVNRPQDSDLEQKYTSHPSDIDAVLD